MQTQITRMYRVRTVAQMLDVSQATIYRAIESGALEALKVGTGKGALRIPADALAAYVSHCRSAAASAVPIMREVA